MYTVKFTDDIVYKQNRCLQTVYKQKLFLQTAARTFQVSKQTVYKQVFTNSVYKQHCVYKQVFTNVFTNRRPLDKKNRAIPLACSFSVRARAGSPLA